MVSIIFKSNAIIILVIKLLNTILLLILMRKIFSFKKLMVCLVNFSLLFGVP
jgi:hypothetical protein